MNRVKFGETPIRTTPSEALVKERVETRRRAPKRITHGEGIVQTTTYNAAAVTRSGKKIHPVSVRIRLCPPLKSRTAIQINCTLRRNDL